jgi:hypothetical protein
MMALGSSQTMSAEDALRDASERLRADVKQRAHAHTRLQGDRERRSLLLRALDAGCDYDGRGSDEAFTSGWIPILRSAAAAWSHAAPAGLLQSVDAEFPLADRLMLAVFRLALRGAPDESLHTAIRTAYSELRGADCPTMMHDLFWILRRAVEHLPAPDAQVPDPELCGAPKCSEQAPSSQTSDVRRTVRVARDKAHKSPTLVIESRADDGSVRRCQLTGRMRTELFLFVATQAGRAEVTWKGVASTLHARGVSRASTQSLQREGRDLRKQLPPNLAACWNQSNSGVRFSVEVDSGELKVDEWVLRLID